MSRRKNPPAIVVESFGMSIAEIEQHIDESLADIAARQQRVTNARAVLAKMRAEQMGAN